MGMDTWWQRTCPGQVASALVSMTRTGPMLSKHPRASAATSGEKGCGVRRTSFLPMEACGASSRCLSGPWTVVFVPRWGHQAPHMHGPAGILPLPRHLSSPTFPSHKTRGLHFPFLLFPAPREHSGFLGPFSPGTCGPQSAPSAKPSSPCPPLT